MNQLDILIIDYLKKNSIYPDSELTIMRKMIQQSHLNFLVKHNAVLITDYEELIYKNNIPGNNAIP